MILISTKSTLVVKFTFLVTEVQALGPYIEKEINLRKSSLCIHVFDGTAIKTDTLSTARQ